ncbi:MAG: hypothetical protein M1813_002217 [Trichoglossum hirsutum]|nr:MAG: hypothetical protein M1813_002217 [Trichoglossum hirsutum]
MRDLKPYTLENFQKHIRQSHADKFAEDQLPAPVKVCQQPLDRLPATTCPFCDDWESKLRKVNKHIPKDEIIVVTPQQFQHHVGSHMGQLALFAIPRGYKEDGDAGSSRAAPGHCSDATSDRSLARPNYEDEENPRLHVAAFEGLEDEVAMELRSDNHGASLQFIAGNTWGSALSAAAAGGRTNIADLCLRGVSSVDSLPRNRKGWSLLHWATSNEHLAMTKLPMGGALRCLTKHPTGPQQIVRLLEGIKQELMDVTPASQDPHLENPRPLRVTIIAAEGLYKPDLFRLPDVLVALTVNGEHTGRTAAVKGTSNPYWNEVFDVYMLHPLFLVEKLERKDRDILGIVDIPVNSVVDLGASADEVMATRDLEPMGDKKAFRKIIIKLELPLIGAWNHPIPDMARAIAR